MERRGGPPATPPPLTLPFSCEAHKEVVNVVVVVVANVDFDFDLRKVPLFLVVVENADAKSMDSNRRRAADLIFIRLVYSMRSAD